MFKLFSRIMLSNWRSLMILFFVILLASTGFITLRQVTTNIDSLVASETRPLFGADLIVSPRGYASGDILPLVSEALSGESYVAAERREFSTTLLDADGKAWLVLLIAYSGSYPQRGILETENFCYSEAWGICSMQTEDIEQILPPSVWQKQWPERVAATPGLIEKFASGGVLMLDERELTITDSITESSDLWFSLGTDNHLLVLPSDLLSGSLLLSSGSRLDQDLYISFADETRADIVAASLKKILPDDGYRVRTYTERTENNLDTVETLTDYITLILLVASVFAFVILRSAHESFYESLARTLRVTEILWLTRTRQRILLLMLYGLIFPLAFCISIGLADVIIELIRRVPEASEFQFFWTALLPAFFLLFFIVAMAWFPVWWNIGGSDVGNTEKRKKIVPVMLKYEASALKSKHTEQILPLSEWQKPHKKWKYRLTSFLAMTREKLFRIEVLIQFALGIIILVLLFWDIVFSLFVVVGSGVFFLVFAWILSYIYGWIFARSRRLREARFYLFDALRALVRPLTPTLPITISLVSVTVFFLVFASFSLAFRSQLVIDSTGTPNIYAINVLESDKEKVEQVIGSGALMYDILRARVSKINSQTLEEHLGVEHVSGEFTREFNITTTPLENQVLQWKKVIEAWEVSVDDEFATRLGLTLWDRVEFLLSWRSITLTVTSVRESIREWFRPFFYFSFDPVEFAAAPRTYFIAEYASDTEAWKRDILRASGPHVTFIDIESILAIVRDISAKVLSVIWLFFAVVFAFAIGAIIAFFIRLRPIEDVKSRLYTLFGASVRDIRTSLSGTRGTIFIVSYILSLIIGGILSYAVLSIGGFFSFSLLSYLMVAGVTGVVYVVMMVGMRR